MSRSIADMEFYLTGKADVGCEAAPQGEMEEFAEN
jgi:hypothetical protein